MSFYSSPDLIKLSLPSLSPKKKLCPVICNFPCSTQSFSTYLLYFTFLRLYRNFPNSQFVCGKLNLVISGPKTQLTTLFNEGSISSNSEFSYPPLITALPINSFNELIYILYFTLLHSLSQFTYCKCMMGTKREREKKKSQICV